MFQCFEGNEKNKSPGSDGLTIEFYKLFWNDIKQYLINSLNFSFQHGHLTPLQNQGIISLLPKKKNDILSINNWRPVSLLNVDCKIATKSMQTIAEFVVILEQNNLLNSSQNNLAYKVILQF